jgi:TolA-binding protein
MSEHHQSKSPIIAFSMRLRELISLVAVLCWTLLPAQQTAVYTDPLVDYHKAVELFQNKQYLAAQNLFSNLEQTTSDENMRAECAYYVANCAVRLNQQNADALVERFVNDYPNSIRRNEAYLEVADYYFVNGKYAYSRKWYERVDPDDLSPKARERFDFNNGYALFSGKQMEEARNYFERVSTSQEYGSQAKYYLGYIAYQQEDYDNANIYFQQVSGIDRYAEGMSYFQADMNFKLGNFQQAIDLALEQLDAADARERSELSKIIGESYFNLEQYAEAIPYLTDYKGKGGRWSNTDYYQLGYAHYRQKDYASAIAEFNKIVDGRNEVAQNAYYHLAESYLKLDRKQEALNAFKNASEMDFKPEIQQDAAFNYAKLSYEIGNSYQSVPEVIQGFLEQYPDHPQQLEMEGLLVDSYISSRNYQAALEILEDRPRAAERQVLQKVAFLRGVELFNEGNFSEARALFDRSLEADDSGVVAVRATYWAAECDYLKGDFEAALKGYEKFSSMAASVSVPESKTIDYNQGYAYFKLQNYSAATNAFQSFIGGGDDNVELVRDAHVRLGDSHFVGSAYQQAITHYGKAIDLGAPDSDYATFQRAISQGFLGETATKISVLSAFGRDYPRSIYRDDALYELGNTYVSLDQTSEAITAYDGLLRQLPGSSYVPKTLLKKALIFENQGDSRQALSLFKRVANDFPGSEESLEAVASAKLIYIDLGEVDQYAEWVRNLDFVDIADAELEEAAYKAAEQPYLQGRSQEAMERFTAYLEQFPNGQQSLKVNFYLAQLYYGEGDKSTSRPYYQQVVERQRSEFTEQSLARLGEIYLGESDYQGALPYLIRLEAEADFPQNVIFARTNAMKAYYETAQYEQAVEYAEKVLESPKIDRQIKADAQVIIARSAMETEDWTRARTAYTEVLKVAQGKLAAEALYRLAYFKHLDREYEASNQDIQRLASEYSGYKEYGARGLILMARNFYALEDSFQATYILESVIANFEEFPEIVEEASTELKVIKAAEAKTNSSVDTEGKQ